MSLDRAVLKKRECSLLVRGNHQGSDDYALAWYFLELPQHKASGAPENTGLNCISLHVINSTMKWPTGAGPLQWNPRRRQTCGTVRWEATGISCGLVWH